MADGYSIKDLPDTSKIEDGKLYLVEGKWINILFSVVGQLWRGENVGKGPNIRLRQLGLAGYSISGADQSGGTGGGQQHAYTVYDASTGSTPKIGVTPGTHNGITPTIYGTPINTKIGTPPAYPVLTLGSGDTLVYFQIDYNSYGQVTSVEIMSTSGSLPTASITPGTAGSDYRLLSTVDVTVSMGKASVQCNNDAVSGPQGYMQCNTYSNTWLA